MRKLIILISAFSSQAAMAQIPATSNWLALQLRINNGKKWELSNDGGYRTIGMSPSAYIYYYRNGLRYNINERWNVAAGTAFFFTRSSYQKSNHEFGREFRLWQEVILREPVSKTLSLNDRFRTEERWFGPVTNKASYFGLRLRDRSDHLSSPWRG